MQPEAEWTVGRLLTWGQSALKELGFREARNSTERCLGAVLRLERHELYLHSEAKVSDQRVKKCIEFIDRRLNREPVAYILNEAWFWKETLYVDATCLIPRPETEMLVGRLIENAGLHSQGRLKILDLGCGSGAIGIALARVFQTARMTFSDISEETLAVTNKNINRYRIKSRSQVVCSDLFEAFKPSASVKESWDVIVCNPPYLTENDWSALEPELAFEPRLALDGGKDGMNFYRRIAEESPGYLLRGGILCVEAGIGQAQAIRSELKRTGHFKSISIFKDYLGIDRVVMAKKSV